MKKETKFLIAAIVVVVLVVVGVYLYKKNKEKKIVETPKEDSPIDIVASEKEAVKNPLTGGELKRPTKEILKRVK